MKSVPLEVTMMKRIGELKAELTACKAEADLLKAEVERYRNNCEYLDKKLDEELNK